MGLNPTFAKHFAGWPVFAYKPISVPNLEKILNSNSFASQTIFILITPARQLLDRCTIMYNASHLQHSQWILQLITQYSAI